MSPSHSHTSPMIQNDDDDSDICPVCDGECTCSSAQNLPPLSSSPPSHRPPPLSMAELSKLYASSPPPFNPQPPPRKLLPISASISPPAHSPPAPKPSLKIKLTLPPSLVAKKRSETPTHATKKYTPPTETTSVVVADGYLTPSPYPSQGPSANPSTSSALPSDFFPKRRGRPPKHVVAAREAARASSTSTGPAHGYATKLPSTYNPRTTLLKSKSAAKPKKKARRRIVESELSSLSDSDHRYDSSPNDDIDDEDPSHLNDDAESLHFPTFVSASALSSMEDDEGEDSGDSSSLSSFDSDSEMEKEEEHFIKNEHSKARVKRELLGEDNPRRRENDWVIRPRQKSVGGSDVDMGDLDTEGSDDEEEGEQGGAGEVNDDDDDDDAEDDEETDGGRPVGAVGLVSGWSEDEESSFDADLFFANLSDSSSSTSSTDEDDGMIEDEDDETQSEMSFSGSAPPLLPSFEIAEAWDGQIVFTNGLSEGQGILDYDYDITAREFFGSPPTHNSDIEMFPMESVEEDDEDEEGYEEDEDAGSGDTTDEELVGEDSLPNERAMKLFSFPFSVSAINPMSTVSPGVSPAPLGRRPAPRPSDILSGRVFWDSDEERSVDGAMPVERPSGLRMGVFVVGEEEERKDRQAVIDEQHRGVVVPSPHPRFVRRRGKRGIGSAVEHALIKHILSTPSTPLQTYPATPHSTPMAAVDDTASAPPTSTEEDPHIEIYDVLDAAYLNEDQSSSSMSEDDIRNKHLDRWNSIPVSAFRQTREAGGSGDWGEDFGAIMKASPLSAIWNKNSNGPKQKRPAISPVIHPVRDGNRTPTNSASFSGQGKKQTHQQQQDNTGSHKKTRQELRRERKLKRKSYGPANTQHHHHHHQHHHHPNSKSRSSSSMQRGFLSSVPPFNL